MEANKGYWVIIKGGHPPFTLTMTGTVNTDTRYIPIATGPAQTHVGTCWPVSRPLSGVTGDDCGLLASGFAGGYVAANSDKVRHFDGISWYAAWHKVDGPKESGVWKGSAGPTGLYLEPVNGILY